MAINRRKRAAVEIDDQLSTAADAEDWQPALPCRSVKCNLNRIPFRSFTSIGGKMIAASKDEPSDRQAFDQRQCGFEMVGHDERPVAAGT